MFPLFTAARVAGGHRDFRCLRFGSAMGRERTNGFVGRSIDSIGAIRAVRRIAAAAFGSASATVRHTGVSAVTPASEARFGPGNLAESEFLSRAPPLSGPALFSSGAALPLSGARPHRERPRELGLPGRRKSRESARLSGNNSGNSGVDSSGGVGPETAETLEWKHDGGSENESPGPCGRHVRKTTETVGL